MAQSSFALLTNTGRAKEAAALANATTIEITHIAIGDGATVPSGGETALYNEVARKTISGHGTVTGAENVAYFDAYLAAGDGPYTIREAGLYDSEGDLIAIAHYDPPISKPVPASGQTVEGTVRIEVAFSNIATVVIKVDPAMLVALQRLTQLPWIAVLELGRNDPPAAPVPGEVYVIGSAPTGAWAGHAGKVAEYTIAGWALLAPVNGHGVGLPDGRVFERVGGVYVEKIALDVQTGKWLYAVAGGTANALTATLTPAPAALVAGMTLRLMITNDNTDAVTLTVPNTGGAKPVRRKDGAELTPGALIAGQVAELIFDGAAWQVVGLVGGSGPMGIERIVTITESTTYVPPPGCRGLLVEGVGGGGAGGGVPTPGSGETGVSSGGSAGGYFRKLITGDDIEESYAVTIGAGGAEVTGATGGGGGTTSFGSACSATGGGGGFSAISGSNVASGVSNGGVGIGGDVVSKGGQGGRGFMIISKNGGNGGVGGPGGSSLLGGGGWGSGSFGVAGDAAVGPGGGGGGSVLSGTSAAIKGGPGAAGVIYVWELM